ncbi:Uncharacterized protein HZ326_9409 [Fusarium oxysporum f. sp. albedinis]|nr:Uncharacterized protein HZ326_9409 [Fusarium oxysporum f. sp. albedinis]
MLIVNHCHHPKASRKHRIYCVDHLPQQLDINYPYKCPVTLPTTEPCQVRVFLHKFQSTPSLVPIVSLNLLTYREVSIGSLVVAHEASINPEPAGHAQKTHVRRVLR